MNHIIHEGDFRTFFLISSSRWKIEKHLSCVVRSVDRSESLSPHVFVSFLTFLYKKVVFHSLDQSFFSVSKRISLISQCQSGQCGVKNSEKSCDVIAEKDLITTQCM